MNQKLIISPSIMCSTPSNMETYIRAFEKFGIDTIHFDVMDGHFVPNVMLSVRDYQAIKQMTELPVDIHLMCTAPDAFIDYFKPQAGDWVSFHPDTCHHPYRLRQEIIREVASVLDFVLVMAVNPGFAGQKMVPDHLDKLKRIKQIIESTGKNIEIMIDGNTTAANTKLMVAAGATGVVAGTSSLMRGVENFEQSYNTYMKELAE